MTDDPILYGDSVVILSQKQSAKLMIKLQQLQAYKDAIATIHKLAMDGDDDEDIVDDIVAVCESLDIDTGKTFKDDTL